MSRRSLYSVMGTFLALGARLGLLGLEAVRAGRLSDSWLAEELAERAHVYLYLTVATLLVFAIFGYLLGREGDALDALARTDPLTGLMNRRALAARVRSEVARARRYGTPLSLLLLDLDGLKRCNDSGGHEAGDAALCSLADALRSGSRAADQSARWGGDEFMMLAPHTGRAEALELAERVRNLVASSGEARVTASIGVATLEPGDPRGAAALEADADTAVYEAKRLGGNRVVVFGSRGDG